MTIRLAMSLLMAAVLLAAQVSCSGSRSRSTGASGVRPLSLPKIGANKPKRTVAVTDEMVVIRRGDKTYVIPREDETATDRDRDGEAD